MNPDIRWKQRYNNFRIARKQLNDLGKAGVVQSFEFTFELVWKTMKDYLNEKGVNVRSTLKT